jgi:hypothetical protein
MKYQPREREMGGLKDLNLVFGYIKTVALFERGWMMQQKWYFGRC